MEWQEVLALLILEIFLDVALKLLQNAVPRSIVALHAAIDL
jgi:hypothetical protein